MTLETTILLVCAAVFMLLVLLIMSLENAVKRAVQENLKAATTDTREKVEAHARDLASLQATVRASADELTELRRKAEALETQASRTETELDRHAETLHAKLAEVDRSRTSVAAEIGRFSDRVGEQQQELRKQGETLRAQGDAVCHLQGDLLSVTAKMDRLRDYLENVFRRDLQGAMRNFDSTVCSVLGEMKSELMQGVHRIETLESAVINRQEATRLLLESELKSVGILEGAADDEPAPAQEPAPADEPTAQADADEDAPDAQAPDAPAESSDRDADAETRVAPIAAASAEAAAGEPGEPPVAGSEAPAAPGQEDEPGKQVASGAAIAASQTATAPVSGNAADDSEGWTLEQLARLVKDQA